ncbi:site-specific integrase [Sphingobium bisphenolivorans]|uniref:site-specific integrase n=1 Tax=Sphingobium bisphenolivorans TaxID=1335760 RepID=UPI0003A7E427|nr:site-specific integrase [Sphingobium bisphenolivorans]
MQHKHHLQCVHGWYRYRRRWPKSVSKIAPGEFFIRCIGTTDLKVAVNRRPYLDIQFNKEVDRLKMRIEAHERAVSPPEIERLFTRWFQREVEIWKEGIPVHFDDASHAEYLDDLATLEGNLCHMLARGQFDPEIEAYTPALFAEEGICATLDDPGYMQLRELMVRAWRELAASYRARLEGNFGYQFKDAGIAAAAAASLAGQPTKVNTIADLIEAYTTDKGEAWSKSTCAAYAPIWRLLREVLGANRDVATVTRDDGRMLFELVQCLPSHMTKKKELRGLSLKAAVQKAKALGLPTLSAKTINDSYMGFLVSIFGWAVREQWLPANPFAGLRVHDPVADEQKRDPFTTEQLSQLFSQAPWSTGDESDPLLYWGPLVALWTGMRRGEIAALRLTDISKVAGTWMILVRKGKTRNARRMIPVHPCLAEIGFLEFVERQRRAKCSQLFPGQKPNSNGQWGDGLSDWFVRLVEKRGFQGTKLGMHSLRHNFEDALREADLHETKLGQYLTGRSGGGSSSSNYGWGYSTARLTGAMDSISYPGLDLSHLSRHTAKSVPLFAGKRARQPEADVAMLGALSAA